MWFLWGVGVGLVIVVVASIVMTVSLTRSGRSAARCANGVWGGLAQLPVDEATDLPQAAAALAQVRPADTTRRGRGGRSAGGILVVTRDELRWEPRVWLGRGRVGAWSLPVRDIRRWGLRRPTGSLVGNELRIGTDDGSLRLHVLDAAGVARALERVCGWSGQNVVDPEE